MLGGQSDDRFSNADGQGDLAALMPLVYDRAREIAGRTLQGDRAQRWVRASSLVHMALLKLLEDGGLGAQSPDSEARLLATLTTIMRRTVVDVARAALADKRGGGAMHISLHTQDLAAARPAIGVVEIDDALRALAGICEESARVAELRLWGGLEFEQIAIALDVPLSRAKSRWNRAKAFLAADLIGDAATNPGDPGPRLETGAAES